MTEEKKPLWQSTSWNPHCDQEQLAILQHCSKTGDISIWNTWRDQNRSRKIWLQHAYLVKRNLKGAQLWQAHLEGARLSGAHLEAADFTTARMQRAVLCGAHLEGADLRGVQLEDAHFNFAVVDGETIISECTVDKSTDFTGVGLGACRIDSGLKQTLEYNIRRKHWQEWCARGPWWKRSGKQLVWLFWGASDYGRSTVRIGACFLGLSVLFALAYRYVPGCVVDSGGGRLRDLWHAFYFSVVTMTTLGFGDIHASPDSHLGQTLLILQVVAGYVILGALVCRLAILFQAGGPAAKFTKPPKPKPETPQEADE